jgi:hypothetical protein
VNAALTRSSELIYILASSLITRLRCNHSQARYGLADGHHPQSRLEWANQRSICTPSGGFCFLAHILKSKKTHDLSTEDGPIERRSKDRTVINRSALMFFMGHSGVYPCCVRDFTRDGAGIRLNGLNILPSDFCISFDNLHTTHRCRLIWRDGDFLGTAFDSKVSQAIA